MAIPANPTLTEIVTEGINQAGEANPSAALITRAKDRWMEEIKNDIWHLAKKMEILHVTSYTVANVGQSRYAYPSDYSSDLNLRMLAGSDVGVAQAGATNNVTLAATDLSTNNIIGLHILMTGGTSAGSYAQIVSYDSVTKIAGVIPNFSVAPIVGDTYLIVDAEYPVEIRPSFQFDRLTNFPVPGLPQAAYPIGNDEEGYFFLDKSPDVMYGMQLRYYVDLSQVDLTSSLMSVLYRRWRNIFVQGIKAKKLLDEDDNRADAEQSKYQSNLRALILRETYGMDLSVITDRVSDYQ